jgi:hypothetical protein
MGKSLLWGTHVLGNLDSVLGDEMIKYNHLPESVVQHSIVQYYICTDFWEPWELDRGIHMIPIIYVTNHSL